ncbi:ATP-binding protein [Helcococcus sueciensis]|uniref:ATP-binding protein n=1 Tax=Helcococcus sueciensis TaxID=241555 RepID=UPI0004131B69|nr:AAA family ATPase [Helcococcus sueciensis]
MIKKIYINNFGKFNNYELEFDKGLNVIYGKNESGKSTILNFILMVLYGSQSKSKDLLQNKRRRYKPWNQEIMKGFIVIEKEGIDYKIERTFLNSNSTDIVDIYNLNTGSLINIPNPKQPGEYFFGIGYETFKKTLFIFSESIVINNDNTKDEITRKLVNLVTTGEEDTSFNSVVSKLDDKIYKIKSRSGKQGRLIDINNKIDNLKLEMEEALSDEKEKSILSNKISSLNKRKKDLVTRIENMQSLIFKKNEMKDILYTKKEYENKRSIYSTVNENREIEFIDEKIDSLNSENSLTKINVFDISIISFIISFTLFRVNKYLAIIVALVSIFIYFLNYSNKEKLKKEKIDKLIIRKEELQKKIEKLDYQSKENENEIYYMNKAIDEIDNYFSSQKMNISDVKYENIEDLRDEILIIDNEIVAIETSAKERFSGKKNFSTIEYEMAMAEKEKEKIEKEFQLYKTTRKLMEKSFERLENNYSVKLNEISSNIINDITNGKYSKLYISNDFSIKVEDSKTKDLIDWKYLSSGTIDQFYLSLRLALIDLLIENDESKILLIDDLFIRFDEDRMRKALDLLINKIEKFSQIFIFTSKEIDIQNFNYNIKRI